MSKEFLQTTILEGLEKAVTTEGYSIYDRFNNIQVGEIVVALTYMLPRTEDEILQNVMLRVLNVFPPEILKDYIDTELNNLFKLKLKNKFNKEQSALLVFYTMVYHNFTFEESISTAVDGVENYLLSYIIHNEQDLLIEVQDNHVEGKTLQLHDTFIRTLISKYSLIPTRETLTEYINYLY